MGTFPWFETDCIARTTHFGCVKTFQFGYAPKHLIRGLSRLASQLAGNQLS